MLSVEFLASIENDSFLDTLSGSTFNLWMTMIGQIITFNRKYLQKQDIFHT